MKRLLLLSFVAMSLFACKDDKNDTPTPAIDYKDPKVLSGALKVQSGTAITGTMPAGTGAAGAPVLNTDFNNQVVPAISGRYAVISPERMSGKFKGYYLRVVGADSYFKVEFPAKTGARKAAGPKGGFLRAGEGPDSLIIIQLPENTNVDTFRIEYAVFDSANVVSNVIKAAIAVWQPAGTGDGAFLVGTWETSRYKSATATEWTMALAPDSFWTAIKCVADTQVVYDPQGVRTLSSTYRNVTDQGAFSSNGAFAWENLESRSILDFTNSRCGNLKYINSNHSYDFNGGWSYNATTKQLIMISDFNGKPSAEDFNVITNHIKEQSATTLLLEDEDGTLTELKKK